GAADHPLAISHEEKGPSRVLIEANSVTKVFETPGFDPVLALKDLTFDIRQGEFVSVVGQSGCGKSTLMKILAGLIPHSAGSLTINGRPGGGASRERAIVFPSPVLLPWR